MCIRDSNNTLPVVVNVDVVVVEDESNIDMPSVEDSNKPDTTTVNVDNIPEMPLQPTFHTPTIPANGNTTNTTGNDIVESEGIAEPPVLLTSEDVSPPSEVSLSLIHISEPTRLL